MELPISGTDLAAELAQADADIAFLRPVWDENRRFLAGDQWPTEDASPAGVADTTRNQQFRLTINLIQNLARHVQAKLGVAYPGIVVLPASPSMEDIAKAQASELFLKYYWQRAKMKGVFADGNPWLVVCGNVAYHTYYVEGEDIRTDEVNPYDVLIESGVQSVQDAIWMARRHRTPLADMVATYPAFATEMEAGSGKVDQGSMPEAIMGEDQSGPDGRVEWFEVYFRTGEHAHVLPDGTELWIADTPIEQIPIRFVTYTPLPGSVRGQGLVDGLKDLQRAYNGSRSLVMDNVKKMARPWWLIPHGSMPKGSINNATGQELPYNPKNGKPSQHAGVPLPQYIVQSIDKTHSEMLDVSGIHSTTLGKRVTGISSGKAIEEMRAGDASQLQLTQDAIEEAVQGVATDVLLAAKRYIKEGQMLRMFDDKGSVVFKEINATDFVETPEVFIESGSLFRDGADEREQRTLQLLELKLIEPEEAKERLRSREGLRSSSLDDLRDSSHAQEMLEAMKHGLDVEVFPTDPLEIFVKVFSEYIRDPEYMTLPEAAQEKIRDLMISVATYQPGNTPLAEQATTLVYPAAPQPPAPAPGPGLPLPADPGLAPPPGPGVGGPMQEAELPPLPEALG